MQVLHSLQMGIALQRQCVKAAVLANACERRLQGAQRLHARFRTGILVLRQHNLTEHVDDGHDRSRKSPFAHRHGTPPLALDPVGVQSLPVVAVQRRQQVCRDADRGKVGGPDGLRVAAPRTTCAE